MEKWALGYLAGHFLTLQLPILLELKVLLLLLPFVIVSFWTFKGCCRPILLGVAFAYFYVSWCSLSFYSHDFIVNKNQIYDIEGEVVSRIVSFDATQLEVNGSESLPTLRFQVRVSSVNGEEFQRNKWPLKSKLPVIYVRWYQASRNLQQGNKVKFKAKLNHSFGYRNEFGFDMRQWFFAQQIYAKGYVKGEVTVVDEIASLKQQVFSDFVALTSKLSSQGYLLALILGDKSLLTSEQLETLNQAGISHLFAISGLHIGIVFLFIRYLLAGLLKPLANHHKLQIITLLSLAPIWAYVFMLDGVISATRAAFFITLWCCIGLLFVHLTNLKRLLYIAVVSLLFEPFAILQPAWWLSFFAVLGILIFIDVLPKSDINKVEITDEKTVNSVSSGHIHEGQGNSSVLVFVGFVVQKLRQLIRFQTFIFFWMIPVTIYWFAGFSLSGWFVNLIAIPLFCIVIIPFVFAVSFLSLIVMQLSEQSISWLGYLYWLPDKLLMFTVQFLERQFWTRVWMDVANDTWVLFPFIFLFVFLLFYELKQYQKTICIVSLLFLIFPYVVINTSSSIQLPSTNRSSNDNLTMRVLDVGQGTSVLFYRNNRAFLYDLGPVFASGFSATKAVVEPTLKGLAINRLDHLVISHQDSDHTGDLQAIERYLPPVIDRQKMFIEHCPKNIIHWQNTVITPMWPLEYAKQKSDNDNSCVLKVQDLASGITVLLTGDISQKIENMLVKQEAQKSDFQNGDRNNHPTPMSRLASDILFSPHHGSKFSSSFVFLKTINPQWLIHTSGLYNRYNFPTQEVVERARKLGIQQLATNELGEITIEFLAENKGIVVKKNIRQWSPFWKKQNPFSFDL